MKFSTFYENANKQLLEALSNLWFKGHPKEMAHFKELIETKEPLISQPVFQTIFPWKNSENTFEEHATRRHILEKGFVDALDNVADPDYRFPADRHPYTHQTDSWKAMLDPTHRKTIVVTSGTGSGKTECFMIPVLQDLVKNRNKGVQAIFLYPLNALMSDQQKRIHEWCKAVDIKYAIYNGDTIENDPGENKKRANYPRLLSREEIRKDPPQVLFTNPTLLNYMLVRETDKNILGISKENNSLRWILLDEAHTYTGSSATELALQVRRVIDAFGDINNVNFAVTSATIGGNDPNGRAQLKKMVSGLTGKDVSDIEIIDGTRIIPPMNPAVLNARLDEINQKFHCTIRSEDIIQLREDLNERPLSLDDITKNFLDNNPTDLDKLKLVDALAEKVPGLAVSGADDALLPTRAHFMIRSINGLYTCTNPNCPDRSSGDPDIGHFTTHLSTICPHPDCHAPMLEVVSCASCGELLLVGDNTDSGYGMRLNAMRPDIDLFDSETDEDESVTLYGDTIMVVGKGAKPCPRKNVDSTRIRFDYVNSKVVIDNGPDSFVETRVDGKYVCPHCGKRLSYPDLKSFCVGAPYLGQILANTILNEADIPSITAGTVHHGQKYITFTDSRQATAKSAMAINHEVERTWIRTQIFQYLAEQRMENYSPGGLSDEEKEDYEMYKGRQNPSPYVLRRIQELEEKLSGAAEPTFKPEAWDTIKDKLLQEQELAQMFEHIAKAKRLNGAYSSMSEDSKRGYLNALFINQMGRAPRRANSPETLGLVKLVYPMLDVQIAPPVFLNAGFTREDWKAFLHICVNFSIRENFHYLIPDGAATYLVQDSFTDPIFGPFCTLESVPDKKGSAKKWPQVRLKKDGTPFERQDRLVLLLCAALGFDSPDDINVSRVNEILQKAWEQISAYALEKVESTDINSANQGYKLDLTKSEKVKLSLVTEGWICPVENAIVTDVFRGFSPRMKGFVNKHNFERYKVKDHLKYPFFPYPKHHKIVDANHSYVDATTEEINGWIDTNWSDKAALGQFSDIIRDIMNIRPIFITAEHSAQLSQAIREDSVEKFKKGVLNILACSTTMEMGVDISGITEVVMNTVPPKPANYLQRSGRAGRRGESKAMAITFCAATPIGNESWNHPDWPMTHPTELPVIKMESRPIIQRHVNAMLFAFHVKSLGGISLAKTVEQFFEKSEVNKFVETLTKLLARVDQIQYNDALSTYGKLVKDTILANQSLEDSISATIADINRVMNIYCDQVSVINDVLAGLNKKDSAYMANDRKLARIRKTNLLSFLSENAFLPSAGMPIGLVEFVNTYDKVKGDEDNEEGFIRKKTFPTKHISQAITEYAPGSQVVINEWCYKSAGVGLSSPFSSTNRSVIQQCSKCKFTTVTVGDPLDDCPECGEKHSMRGVLEKTKFTEIVEPISFCVDSNETPSRNLRNIGSGYSVPKMLNMPPWPDKAQGAKYVVRSSSDSTGSRNPEILFFNRGSNGKGYAYCPFCGRMEEMPADENKTPMEKHLRLDDKIVCESANLGHIRTNVILAGRYQTDFVEIRFYDKNGDVITDNTTLYTLGIIITRKLTEVLGINDGEIGFGLNDDYDSIFIYDTAIGGAGYSILFREFSTQVLDGALDDLKACNCERACTNCLIDRRSQWSLDLLDRHAAIKWLELEKASRDAPREAINIFGNDVWALTSDFASELCTIASSGNLTKLKFCISTDVSRWNASEFRYTKLIDEIKRRGVDVSFVLENTIDLSGLDASQLSTCIEVLFKEDFDLGTFQCGTMRPLVYAEFSGGSSKLYFGSTPERSLGSNWGLGKILVAKYTQPLSLTSMDKVSLISQIQSSSFVKHFKVTTKNAASSRLLETIIKDEGSNDWSKISTKLTGKTVTIIYNDKHLNSPLAVFLLVRLIDQLKKKYSLTIQNVTLRLGFLHDYGDPTVPEISRYFSSTNEQSAFIIDCFATIGVTPTIDRGKVYEHERNLLVSDSVNELSILPNGGISWGWKLDNANVGFYTKDDILDPDCDPVLYNSSMYGITYTIVLSD